MLNDYGETLNTFVVYVINSVAITGNVIFCISDFNVSARISVMSLAIAGTMHRTTSDTNLLMFFTFD